MIMQELTEQAQQHPILLGIISIVHIIGGFLFGLINIIHIPPVIIQIFQLVSFIVGILVGIVTLITWFRKNFKK